MKAVANDDVVGRWLAAAGEINVYIITFGILQIEDLAQTQAPSDEGAVIFLLKND